MLLAATASEAQALQERIGPLHNMGIQAVFYDSAAVKQAEPALTLPSEGGALLVQSDAQLVSNVPLLLFTQCIICLKPWPVSPPVSQLYCWPEQ